MEQNKTITSSSFDLCDTLAPDNAKGFQLQMRLLRMGLDRATIDPQTISESKCFPAFVELQNRPPPHQGYINGIFVNHFPQFLLPSNALTPPILDNSSYNTYETYEGGDGEGKGEAKYPRRHVATPTVSKVVRDNLLPELIDIIGNYHTNCDTLTEGGTRCGIGDRGDFAFRHNVPSSAGTDDEEQVEQCQSECTGHLCTAWLTNLLANLPTEVVVTVDASKGGRQVPVRITDINLEILGTFWSIDLPIKSRELSSSSSLPFAPEFLAAGCRILNSGRELELIVTIKLEEATVKRVGLLKNLYHDNNQISFPGLPKGNYFRNTNGWRLRHPNTLRGVLIITDRKTQNELFAKRREQQKLQQQAAAERRKRTFQTMSIPSPSSYLPTLSTLPMLSSSSYSGSTWSSLLTNPLAVVNDDEEGGGEPVHKNRRTTTLTSSIDRQ